MRVYYFGDDWRLVGGVGTRSPKKAQFPRFFAAQSLSRNSIIVSSSEEKKDGWAGKESLSRDPQAYRALATVLITFIQPASPELGCSQGAHHQNGVAERY